MITTYIYLIPCNCECAGYIGQTANPADRRRKHNTNLINSNDTVKYNFKVYKHLRECGVKKVDLMIIDTITQLPNQSIKVFEKEVRDLEEKWMADLGCTLNSCNGRTKAIDYKKKTNKEYRTNNKDAIAKQRREKRQKAKLANQKLQ